MKPNERQPEPPPITETTLAGSPFKGPEKPGPARLLRLKPETRVRNIHDGGEFTVAELTPLIVEMMRTDTTEAVAEFVERFEVIDEPRRPGQAPIDWGMIATQLNENFARLELPGVRSGLGECSAELWIHPDLWADFCRTFFDNRTEPFALVACGQMAAQGAPHNAEIFGCRVYRSTSVQQRLGFEFRIRRDQDAAPFSGVTRGNGGES